MVSIWQEVSNNTHVDVYLVSNETVTKLIIRHSMGVGALFYYSLENTMSIHFFTTVILSFLSSIVNLTIMTVYPFHCSNYALMPAFYDDCTDLNAPSVGKN